MKENEQAITTANLIFVDCENKEVLQADGVEFIKTNGKIFVERHGIMVLPLQEYKIKNKNFYVPIIKNHVIFSIYERAERERNLEDLADIFISEKVSERLERLQQERRERQ